MSREARPRSARVDVELTFPLWRLVVGTVLFCGLGVGTILMSFDPKLADRQRSAPRTRYSRLGRLLTAVDPIGNFWPVPLALGVAFVGGGLFFVGAMASISGSPRRLRIGERDLTFPRGYFGHDRVSLTEIRSVEIEASEKVGVPETIVIATRRGKHRLSMIWFPKKWTAARVANAISDAVEAAG